MILWNKCTCDQNRKFSEKSMYFFPKRTSLILKRILSKNVQEALLNDNWNKQKANGKKAVTFYRAFNSYSEKLKATCHVDFYKYDWWRKRYLPIHSWISEKRGILYSNTNLQMEVIKDKAFFLLGGKLSAI